jgi:hypothetical protein
MSTFQEEINLVNARDMGNTREGLIPDTKVRKTTITARQRQTWTRWLARYGKSRVR